MWISAIPILIFPISVTLLSLTAVLTTHILATQLKIKLNSSTALSQIPKIKKKLYHAPIVNASLRR